VVIYKLVEFGALFWQKSSRREEQETLWGKENHRYPIILRECEDSRPEYFPFTHSRNT